jgi:hypothetical protein
MCVQIHFPGVHVPNSALGSVAAFVHKKKMNHFSQEKNQAFVHKKKLNHLSTRKK